MKNLIKLNIAILLLSIVLGSASYAGERILPLPKPSIDLETKNIVAKKI